MLLGVFPSVHSMLRLKKKPRPEARFQVYLYLF
jgi:hypothetical protein